MLQDYQKTISALNAEQAQIKKMVLQNKLALDILKAAQRKLVPLFIPIYTCMNIYTCCTYIPDMNANVTHFTKYMNKMIGTIDTPEASTASL